jgi:16S rRNA (guanine527-N7)-methyltransferase
MAEEYCRLLATAGVERGLIGPREAPRLWERHLLNCAVIEQELGQEQSVCDLGSGAGLPGLVLAITRPDLHITLVEPLLRRATFLTEAVAHLGVEGVEVVRARAEDLHGKREFDIVTSRALAPLPRLLAWSMPLVRRGGAMVVMKGTRVQEELNESGQALRTLAAGTTSVHKCGVGVIDPPTTVLRVAATRPSQLAWDDASGKRQGRGQKKGRK